MAFSLRPPSVELLAPQRVDDSMMSQSDAVRVNGSERPVKRRKFRTFLSSLFCLFKTQRRTSSTAHSLLHSSVLLSKPLTVICSFSRRPLLCIQASTSTLALSWRDKPADSSTLLTPLDQMVLSHLSSRDTL